MQDNINSDLVENPGTDVPQAGAVTEVAVPESDAGVWDPFGTIAAEENPEQEESLFDSFPTPEEETKNAYDRAAFTVKGVDRPIASSILALAMSDPRTVNPITALTQKNLETAQSILDNQQEYNARLRVANERAYDTLRSVAQLRDDLQQRAREGHPISPETMALLDETYQGVLTQNREEAANIALELEAVDRIRGALVEGDPHEAWIVRDQFFMDGKADQRISEFYAKVLLASQRLEEFENEYQDSGWIRGFFNGLIRFTPTLDMFSASGIMNDAGVTDSGPSIIDFILAGDNLNNQRGSLWDLPLDEFASALGPNGVVTQSIRDNAGWLMNDPARAREVSKALLSAELQDPTMENVVNGLDAALLIGGVAGKLGSTLIGAGSRKMASEVTAKAAIETVTKGSDAAKAATGIDAAELAENLTPSFFKDVGDDLVGISQQSAQALRIAEEMRKVMPEVVATSQLDNVDDIVAAYEAVEKSIRASGKHADHIQDIKYVEENVRTGQTRDFGNTVSEDGSTIQRIQVIAGKKDGGGYAKKVYAEGLLEKFGREGEVFKDPASNQWFARFDVDVPVDGMISSKLDTPNAALATIRSSARIADQTAVAKGIVSGNAANRFLKSVELTLKNAVKGIPRKDMGVLNDIIKKGHNENRYWDEQEFSVMFERTRGFAPSDKVKEAYSVYRATNDLAYLIRNERVYLDKLSKGFESHKLRLGGREVDIDAQMVMDPKKKPTGKDNNIWDSTKERWLDVDADQIAKMSDEGYVMLKLDRAFKMPDGRATRFVMVKRGDVTTRPLRRAQLNYSEGGSRAYDATHFIKQAAEDVDGALMNPKTYVAGKDLNEMKAWAFDMNAAIDLFKAGSRDPMEFADIFKNRPGYPEPEEFLQKMRDGEISSKYKFEVVEEGKSHSAYLGKTDDALRFVDREQLDLDNYYDSTGQMYYGTKGDALRDTTGDFAQVIDPWDSLNASVNEASRAFTFRGYKQNTIERFRNTYGQYVEGGTDSLWQVAKAEIRRDVPKDIANKIRNEQKAISRLMHFETEFEKVSRERWRSLGEWVLGDAADDSLRAAVRRGMIGIERARPIDQIRKVAFDSNLGFFNVGQLFIQSSTMASAFALNPKHGSKGFALVPLMKMWSTTGYTDNMLDHLARNPLVKFGFDSPEEFKMYATYMKESGLYEVSGHNLAMIREFGANKIFGASSKYDAGAEKGRMFFYFAEQMNRTVASRIAWGELVEKGIKPGTSEFREKFALLTDDYSFNMMNQTAAGFQRGLPAIPTQFWAYSFRMADALLGKRFTWQQKTRLLMMNTMMAGGAAIPGGAAVQSIYEKYTGRPVSIEEADGWIARGLIDGLAYLATDADVEIGARIGTGDLVANIAKDVFGYGEYGEKSMGEMLLGATGGKLGSAIPALKDALYFSASELLGHDMGGLTKDSWVRLADDISTFRSAHRAFIAHQYNRFYTKNGMLVADDLPESSAFFFALSFTPAEQSKLSFYFDGAQDGEAIKEAANKLSAWRQEAFTDPDKFEENRQKAQAFLSLYPPHVRVRIRQQARVPETSSLYETIKKKYEKDAAMNDFYDAAIPETEAKIMENLENE